MKRALFVLVFCCTSLTSRSVAQTLDLDTKLQREVRNYELVAGNFLEGLLAVASKNEIPLGVEWVRGSTTVSPILISLERSTIRQVLAAIVATNSEYGMDVSNGVLHVFPRGSAGAPDDFLNVRIQHFEVKNEFIAVASRQLETAVRLAVRPPAPMLREQGILGADVAAGSAGHTASGLGDKQISFSMDNSKARDILDRLLQMGDLKIWVVTLPSDGERTRTGFKKVSTLYTQDVLADSEQPAWDLLLWGFDPFSQSLRQDWYKRRLIPNVE